MLTIVATVKAKREDAEFVGAELEKLVAPTRKEEGCIDYYMHRDNEDDATFLFYENWESAEHLDRHMAAPHFTACFSAIDGKTEAITVNRLTRLP